MLIARGCQPALVTRLSQPYYSSAFSTVVGLAWLDDKNVRGAAGNGAPNEYHSAALGLSLGTTLEPAPGQPRTSLGFGEPGLAKIGTIRE